MSNELKGSLLAIPAVITFGISPTLYTLCELYGSTTIQIILVLDIACLLTTIFGMILFSYCCRSTVGDVIKKNNAISNGSLYAFYRYYGKYEYMILCVHGIVRFGYQFLFTFSLYFITTSVSHTIFNSSFIIIQIFISKFYFKSFVHKYQYICITLMVVGNCMAVGLMTDTYKGSTANTIIGVGLTLLGGLCWALCDVLKKKGARNGVEIIDKNHYAFFQYTIMLVMCFGITIGCTIARFDDKNWTLGGLITFESYVPLLILCILGILYYFVTISLVVAYQIASLHAVSVIFSLNILITYLSASLLLDQHNNYIEWIGMAITLVGLVISRAVSIKYERDDEEKDNKLSYTPIEDNTDEDINTGTDDGENINEP